MTFRVNFRSAVAGLFALLLSLPTVSRAETVSLNGYDVTFGVSSENFSTTYTYTVCRNGAGSNLSTFAIGVPGCFPNLVVESALPAGAGYGRESQTGIKGFSWNISLSSSCRTYSYKVQNISESSIGLVNVGVVAGSTVSTGYISGPLCVRQSLNQCGISAPADIVIMIDKTGSISTAELAAEREAAKYLLNEFGTAVERPNVAIATFNVQSGADARIVTGGALTSNYGVDGADATGLYHAIDSITSRSGGTNLVTALDVAQAHLQSGFGDPQTPNYIVLLSDGQTNEPDSWGGKPGFPASNTCVNSCDCLAARVAALNARFNAINAQPLPTKIFAIHFGSSPGDCTAAQVILGHDYLRDQIASQDSGMRYFYEGNSTNLNLIFDQIAGEIACSSTIYQCGSDCVSGQCVGVDCPTPTPVPSPTATPTRTSTPTATPSRTSTPTLTATATSTVTATATPSKTAAATRTPTRTATTTATRTSTPSATSSPIPSPTPTQTRTAISTVTPTAIPLSTATPFPSVTATPFPTVSILDCDEIDIRKIQGALDGNARKQRNLIKGALALLKTQPVPKYSKRFAQTTLQKADALYQESWTTIWTLQSVMKVCQANPLCITSSNTNQIDHTVKNSRALRDLVKTVLKKFKSQKLRAKVKEYSQRANKLYQQDLVKSAEIPTSSSLCGG